MTIETATHVHDWGDSNTAPAGMVSFCKFEGCAQCAVRDRYAKRWGLATGEELLTITARMMMDIVTVQTMRIVHGRDAGTAKAFSMLGYDR